jgi:hypothetical protein
MRARPGFKLFAAAAATVAFGLGGAVTVVATATPAGAATVTTEAQFRAAWDKDTDITLGADITLTCGFDSPAGRSGSADFVLDGMGHTITQTCPDAGVLMVDFGAGNGTIKNVTITGGNNLRIFGGGLWYDATNNLTLDHVAIVGNASCTDGGGLIFDSRGMLTITHSTIANNISGGYGGGIWAAAAQILLVDSTVSGNTARHDAAIEGDGAHATFAYSTIVRNGLGAGAPTCLGETSGASHANPSATAAADTQIDMSDASVSPTLTSFGTVVADPLGGAHNCSMAPLAVTSQGYNFSDDSTCAFTGTGDQQNAGDPGLGVLGANGGFAPTQVPQVGSPLQDAIPIDACRTGVASSITDDEHDTIRPQGDECDIGAVETTPTAPTPTPAPAVTIAPNFTG